MGKAKISIAQQCVDANDNWNCEVLPCQARRGASKSKPASRGNDDIVARICEMGFSQQRVRDALERAGGNPQRTVALLTGSSLDMPPVSRAKPSIAQQCTEADDDWNCEVMPRQVKRGDGTSKLHPWAMMILSLAFVRWASRRNL